MTKIYIIMCMTDNGEDRIYKDAYSTIEQAMDALEKLNAEEPLGSGVYYFSEVNLIK